jgi:hypothetical protein
MPKLRKLVLFGLGTATLLAVLAVTLLVLVAPALIDTPAVRAEIQRRLSAALQGQVAWDSLEVELLPPRAEIDRVRVDIPDKVAVTAERLTVALRFWPLLRGEVEISSAALQKPNVRILAKGDRDQPLDPLGLYRAVAEPAAKILQDVAPDMTLRIEQGEIDRFRNVDFTARTGATGVDLELSAAGDLWKRLSANGRIEYADLAARARLSVEGWVFDADIPPATMHAQLRTDAKTLIECEFDGSVGTLGSAKGSLVFPQQKMRMELSAVDLPRVLHIVARKLPGKLAVIESSEGRVSVRAELDFSSSFHLQAQVTRSDAAVKLALLPWKISASDARVTVTPKEVHVTGARGKVGDSTFEHAAARIEFGQPARLSSASGQAKVKLEQWLPWLKTRAPLEEIDSASGSVDVKLNRLALRFDRPQEVDFDTTAVFTKNTIALRSLPAPVALASGSVQADRAQVRFHGIAASLLDASTVASGSFDFKKSVLQVSLGESVAGEKLVRWGMERAEVPQRFEPRTPLRFTAPRIEWAPKQPLVVEARAQVERGPRVEILLVSQPGLLELRRVTVKDAASDARLSARIESKLIEATFSGTLHERSLAALRASGATQPGPGSGAGIVRGELLMSMDRAEPQNSTSEGRLQVESLDLTWLAGKRAVIESIDLTADKTGVRVADARLDWDEQRFRLRGELRRTGEHPVIDAQLESPGVDLKRLLPPAKPPGEKSPEVWPLPARGRIEVRTAFLDYDRYRVAPFDGVLLLEPRKARLEIKQAGMCGVSFPLELETAPDHTSLDIRLAMKDQPFEKSLHCLTGGTMQITGNADLQAVLRTEGRRPHLLRNMTGTARLDLRDGQVKKFAAFGNILSVRNIGDVKRMNQEGFPYRRMHARGRFANGKFLVDEAAFDSRAVHLAATGEVDLLGDQSRITVLVGLLTTIDRIAGAIPIIGDIFGSSLTALPVSVSGDIRDPLVVPLGPGAITERLVDILKNTANLPGKLLVPGQPK